MSDALISHHRFDEERVEQAEAVNAGRDAMSVATDRCKEGKANYYEVLEAQQQLFPAENELSQIEAGRRLAVVQLYKVSNVGNSVQMNLVTVQISTTNGTVFFRLVRPY